MSTQVGRGSLSSCVWFLTTHRLTGLQPHHRPRTLPRLMCPVHALSPAREVCVGRGAEGVQALEIDFAGGDTFRYSAELLRVLSPSADSTRQHTCGTPRVTPLPSPPHACQPLPCHAFPLCVFTTAPVVVLPPASERRSSQRNPRTIAGNALGRPVRGVARPQQAHPRHAQKARALASRRRGVCCVVGVCCVGSWCTAEDTWASSRWRRWAATRSGEKARAIRPLSQFELKWTCPVEGHAVGCVSDELR